MERRVGGGGRGGEREMDREDMKGGRNREERGGGRRGKQEGMKQAHIRSALRGAEQGLQPLQPLGQGSPQGRATAVGGGLGQPLAVGEGEERQLVREGAALGATVHCICHITCT